MLPQRRYDLSGRLAELQLSAYLLPPRPVIPFALRNRQHKVRVIQQRQYIGVQQMKVKAPVSIV